MGRVKQTIRKGGKAPVHAKKAPAKRPASTKSYPRAALGPKEGGATPVKKRRFHPGTVALREIRYYQRATGNLASKRPIVNLVRRIASHLSASYGGDPPRFTAVALTMLQSIIESYVVNEFHRGNRVGLHCGRKTLMAKDMQLVGSLFKEDATNVPAT